jgi:hypothetical protein
MRFRESEPAFMELDYIEIEPNAFDGPGTGAKSFQFPILIVTEESTTDTDISASAVAVKHDPAPLLASVDAAPSEKIEEKGNKSLRREAESSSELRKTLTLKREVVNLDDDGEHAAGLLGMSSSSFTVSRI